MSPEQIAKLQMLLDENATTPNGLSENLINQIDNHMPQQIANQQNAYDKLQMSQAEERLPFDRDYHLKEKGYYLPVKGLAAQSGPAALENQKNSKEHFDNAMATMQMNNDRRGLREGISQNPMSEDINLKRQLQLQQFMDQLQQSTNPFKGK